ncbi:hypothetical protein L2252_11595 [Mesorhizobium muleiense]|nr:hypothetical protein [Mesorhizobium muleiense]
MLKNIQDRLAFSRLVNHTADAGIAARGWIGRRSLQNGRKPRQRAACALAFFSAKAILKMGNPETRAILKNVKAGDRVKCFG